MIINDAIYGKYKINEPVLVELIKSRPMQRLKKIAQLGIPNRFYHIRGFSRFEHSLGVMLLLRKLNASLEEQAAGLLHDVSHTAFSHVFDWTVGNQEAEDYQDKSYKKFFFNSEIPGILREQGFNVNKISDLKQFSLLEKEIPSLCADRIDYALREFHLWANPEAVEETKVSSSPFAAARVVDYLVEHLSNLGGKIVFTNQKSAYLFATTFLKCQREHWGGEEAVTRYYLFSLILKDALNKKILNIGDFYQDDNFVVSKLIKSRDRKILKQLNLLKNKTLSRRGGSVRKIVRKKFRYVDPEFLIAGKIKKLSQASEKFKLFLERQKLLNQKGVTVFYKSISERGRENPPVLPYRKRLKTEGC